MDAAPPLMTDVDELDWLSHVAAAMLAVRAGVVVAMNAGAAELFGLGPDALPVEIATVLGNAAAAQLTPMLQPEAEPAPADFVITCDVQGMGRALTLGARRVRPAGADGAELWALTVIPAPAAGASPTDAETPVPATPDWVRLLPAIIDHLPVALLIEDESDTGVFVNRGFTDVFEYRLEDIAALEDWWNKLYPDALVREEAKRDWAETLANAASGDGTISSSEFQIRCGGGSDKMVQFHSFRINGYRVHSYFDVTNRHRLATNLEILANTDALTGTRNRRSFLQHAGAVMRAGQPFAALVLDVDHFKQVNDRFGHGFGDQVLVEVAARCRAALRPGDVLARIGGEEFAVLLPGDNVTGAGVVAERLRAAVAGAPVSGPLGSHPVSISVGGACAWAGASLEDLLQCADNALYAAKRAGRNCVRFDPGRAPAPPLAPEAELDPGA